MYVIIVKGPNTRKYVRKTFTDGTNWLSTNREPDAMRLSYPDAEAAAAILRKRWDTYSFEVVDEDSMLVQDVSY